MEVSAGHSSPLPAGTPTIQNLVQSLLQHHSAKNFNTTHLHPFAPSSSTSSGQNTLIGRARADKGKRRAEGCEEDEEEKLKQLRETLVGTRELLGRYTTAGTGLSGQEGDSGRLIRALKEISTHQIAVLSSTSFQSTPRPPITSLSSPLFPSSLILIPPITLLQVLSTSIGLQAFIEDSQFGLLKSSIAIAGARVVVDVDLETDTLTGDDEDEDISMPGTATTVGPLASATPGERGKVRLSKLTANHVTSSGGTGKSNHITSVLRAHIERYLDLWNGPNSSPAIPSPDDHPGADVWKKERYLGELRETLKELKELDEIAEAQAEGEAGTDWFDVLEKGADYIEGLQKGDGPSAKIYPTRRDSVFPTFHLLPSSAGPSSSSAQKSNVHTDEYNPTFHLRPAGVGEHVSAPSTSSIEGAEDVSMDDKWTEGDWVLEVVPDDHGVDGLVVRRNWLTGEEGKNVEGSGIRVENLLYRAFPNTSLLSSNNQAQAFPYTSTFVHAPSKEADATADSQKETGLEAEQHWSIAQPGPPGFVVGKTGVPRSVDGLQRLLKALKRQVVLNTLFNGVFQARFLGDPAPGGEEDDDDDDDLLDGPQKTIPITVSLLESSLEVSFPLIQADGDVNNIRLVLTYREDVENHVAVDLNPERGMEIKLEGERDLVALVQSASSKSKDVFSQ